MADITPLAVVIGVVAYFITVLITGSPLGPIALAIDWICGMGGVGGLAACQ